MGIALTNFARSWASRAKTIAWGLAVLTTRLQLVSKHNGPGLCALRCSFGSGARVLNSAADAETNGTWWCVSCVFFPKAPAKGSPKIKVANFKCPTNHHHHHEFIVVIKIVIIIFSCRNPHHHHHHLLHQTSRCRDAGDAAAIPHTSIIIIIVIIIIITSFLSSPSSSPPSSSRCKDAGLM